MNPSKKPQLAELATSSSDASASRVHTKFQFPPWYYRHTNSDLDCSVEPKTHMYLADRQALLRGVDKFMKHLGVSYSLWGGSLIAVVRANMSGEKAMSMPWDVDIDVALTESGWSKFRDTVPNLRQAADKAANSTEHKLLAMQQAMFDFNGSDPRLTILNDNLGRVMMSSFAHGELKNKWLGKLLQTTDLNLDRVVPPGAYADIIGYKHIPEKQKVVDCTLDGVTVSCAADMLMDATTRDAWVKEHEPFGAEHDPYHPDHHWDAAQCGFVCDPKEGKNSCLANNDQLLINETKFSASNINHKWGESYPVQLKADDV